MDRLTFNAMASINEERLVRQQLVNDLANVNTVGFKRTFEATLQPQMAVGKGFDSRLQPLIYTNDHVQLDNAPLMVTGRDLDVAFNNQTVLGVTGQDGTLGFTRRGDFHVNSSGVLETGDHHVVRSQDGQPITIPQGLKISFAGDGTIYASDPNQPGVAQQVVGQLMLRDASTTPLIKREDGLYRVDEKPTGTDIATGPVPVSLTPQALEGSSVNPMTAMVRLIDESRSFEQQVRVISEAKSNDESGASMMRLSS
jgi:flagellar basal-body rod protein FlgF